MYAFSWKMTRSHVWWCKIPLLLLFLLCHSTLSDRRSSDERVAELLNLQALSTDGVIHFDDNSVRRFVQAGKPRPYSLVMFFDAKQLRDNSELRLADLRREFGLMATAFVKNNEGKGTVFFAEIEFQQSQASFALFKVSNLPHIRHLSPDKDPEDADRMDYGDISRSAEGMAAFVESKTKQRVGPIGRPPPITKKQLVLLAGGLLLAAPFVMKKIMTNNTPLHDRKVWCSLALFVYFFSVSGGMHNIIRRVPFVINDRANPGKLVFFFQGSGMQLGAEGFVVGFLYTIVGLMLAIMTHFLVQVRNMTIQRVILLVMMTVCFWAVKKVIHLDNWKTGYAIHGYWPRSW